MKRILFVCTGNTCRSPLAEHLLKFKAADTYEVRSAGLAAFEGEDAALHVHQVLQEKGISIQHKSQLVNLELVEWADLILTMTQQHQQILQSNYPYKAEQIITLKGYVTGSTTDKDIADPYGGPIDLYRQTMLELEQLLEQMVEKDKGANMSEN